VTDTTARTQQADLPTLARGGALNLVGAVTSGLSNFVLVLVITRTLAPAEAGRFFAATSVFLLLVGLGRVGAGGALVYFVTRLRLHGNERGIKRLLKWALLPVLGLSSSLGLLMWTAAAPLADMAVRGPSESTAELLRTLAVFVPLAAMLDGVLGATRGFGNLRITVLVENTFRPITQLTGVFLLGLAGSTWLVVLGWSVPYALALVAGLFALYRLLHSDRNTARPQPVEVEGLVAQVSPLQYWRFAAPRAFSTVVQVALQRADVLIISALLGPTPAIMYVAATRIVALGSLGVQAIAMTVEPQVARHSVKGEIAAMNQVYATSTGWLMLVNWPIFVLAIAFAPTLLSLFGEEYRAAAPVLIILACASLLSNGCGVVDSILTMTGRTKWILGNVTLALVVNIALNLVLVPRIGSTGAAWAWAAAIVLNNVLPLVQLLGALKIHPFGRQMLGAFTAVALGYVSACSVAVALWGQTLFAFTFAVASGTAVYLAVLWLLRSTLQLDALLLSLPFVGGRASITRQVT
jgi:O-antigen/teichoic acid export membrane protein